MSDDCLYVLMIIWMRHPERLRYFQRTLEALFQYLIYSGELRILVSCEGEGNDHKTFQQYLNYIRNQQGLAAHVRNGPPSIGDQNNFLLSMIPDEAILLYVQGDRMLRGDFDVTEDVTALRNGQADMIRYCWWHEHYHANPVNGDLNPQVTAEHRLIGLGCKWLFSDTPFMARRDLFTRAGPFLPGISEWEYSERLRGMMQRGERVTIWGRGEGKPWFTDEFFVHVGQRSTVGS